MFGKKGLADNLVSFFIGLMVVVIIAVSVVIPVIQTQIDSLNASPTVKTLLDLLPLFIVLAILILVVGVMRF
jgi:uncharacterized BrkB/YihY/UPF0761 family membrane protein